MSRNVNIKCRYYQVREMWAGEPTEHTYDLRRWLDEMEGRALPERYKEANGIRGRLENIARISGTEIYALNFMRVDEISTSYKVRISDPAEHIDIDIEADEHIAKNTVCLYDAETGIIMIQCNRGSYSGKSIQSYINCFFEESVCCLLPILETVNFMADDVEYMKVDVRLANLREFEPTHGSSFERIIDGMNQIEGISAHLEIGLGRERNARLNSEEMRATIADLLNNRGCVTSAKIKLSDDQVTGVYDLFDNLCNDTVSCLVDENGGIPFERLSNRMYDKYALEHADRRILQALNN